MRRILILSALCVLLLAAASTGAAAQQKTTFHAKVQNGIYDSSAGTFTQGKSFGTIAIDSQANTWTLKPSKSVQFTPGTHALGLSLTPATPTTSAFVIGHVTVDEKGKIVTAKDQPFDILTGKQVAAMLESGCWIFVSDGF